MIPRLFSFLTGYVFGLFQTAYIYSRLKGVDIRTMGSGNSGTTNALRSFGKKAGLLVLLGDMIKSLLACFTAYLIFHDVPELHGGSNLLWMLWAGLGCTLGHNFPFYMNFRGGKGMAVMGGLILSLDWRLALIGLPVFVLSILITKYVSVGSMLLAVTFAVGWVIIGITGHQYIYPELLTESYILVIVIATLAVFQHRKNIRRLIDGNENKLFGNKKSEKEN